MGVTEARQSLLVLQKVYKATQKWGLDKTHGLTTPTKNREDVTVRKERGEEPLYTYP